MCPERGGLIRSQGSHIAVNLVVDSKLGTKMGVDSCQPPPPSGRSQANSLRLFVCGPDGDFSQLDGVNPSITARELAKEFIESRYGYFRGGRLVVVYERDDQRVPLAPRQTLEENCVTDGDRLGILWGRTLSGGPFELVVAFVVGAVASGVLGNASYDLLKEVLGRLRNRFRSAKDTQLSEQDVADIAVACCCIRLKIEDFTKVIAYDAWIDPHNIGIYPPPVPDRVIGNVILHTPRGAVYAIILPAADGNPDGLQIELQFPGRSGLHWSTIDE